MSRLRCAVIALAAGSGLVCGCLNLSQHPLLSRFRLRPGMTDCCEGGGLPEEGVIADSVGFPVVPPGAPAQVPSPYLTPQNSVPELAPAPVPMPTSRPQAPRTPYKPNDKE
jgi:hypothetical protein